MFPVESLVRIIFIATTYLLVIPFQLVIFPSNYYSVRDIIYSRSLKKASLAAAARFVFIFLDVSLCSFFECSAVEILWGFGIGSFLCSWPSIYHYQLFVFFRHGIKLCYFISCLLSVVFTVVCAWFSVDTLISMITMGKEFFLLDNSGFNFVMQMIGMCIPVSVRQLLERIELSNPYMDGDTFAADLIMTQRKMWFEQKFCDQYFYEINQAADKYEIHDKLLETIILLELTNRKSWYMQLAEKIVCRYFPQIAIRRNMTLGVAQISVSVAKEYYQQAPTRFLGKMLKPEESIELCAFYLRRLIDQYNRHGWEDSDEWIDEIEGLTRQQEASLFIASQYICGCNVSLRKFALVYMTILSPFRPLDEIGGNA